MVTRFDISGKPVQVEAGSEQAGRFYSSPSAASQASAGKTQLELSRIKSFQAGQQPASFSRATGEVKVYSGELAKMISISPAEKLASAKKDRFAGVFEQREVKGMEAGLARYEELSGKISASSAEIESFRGQIKTTADIAKYNAMVGKHQDMVQGANVLANQLNRAAFTSTKETMQSEGTWGNLEFMSGGKITTRGQLEIAQEKVRGLGSLSDTGLVIPSAKKQVMQMETTRALSLDTPTLVQPRAASKSGEQALGLFGDVYHTGITMPATFAVERGSVALFGAGGKSKGIEIGGSSGSKFIGQPLLDKAGEIAFGEAPSSARERFMKKYDSFESSARTLEKQAENIAGKRMRGTLTDSEEKAFIEKIKTFNKRADALSKEQAKLEAEGHFGLWSPDPKDIAIGIVEIAGIGAVTGGLGTVGIGARGIAAVGHGTAWGLGGAAGYVAGKKTFEITKDPLIGIAAELTVMPFVAGKVLKVGRFLKKPATILAKTRVSVGEWDKGAGTTSKSLGKTTITQGTKKFEVFEGEMFGDSLSIGEKSSEQLKGLAGMLPKAKLTGLPTDVEVMMAARQVPVLSIEKGVVEKVGKGGLEYQKTASLSRPVFSKGKVARFEFEGGKSIEFGKGIDVVSIDARLKTFKIGSTPKEGFVRTHLAYYGVDLQKGDLSKFARGIGLDTEAKAFGKWKVERTVAKDLKTARGLKLEPFHARGKEGELLYDIVSHPKGITLKPSLDFKTVLEAPKARYPKKPYKLDYIIKSIPQEGGLRYEAGYLAKDVSMVKLPVGKTRMLGEKLGGMIDRRIPLPKGLKKFYRKRAWTPLKQTAELEVQGIMRSGKGAGMDVEVLDRGMKTVLTERMKLLPKDITSRTTIALEKGKGTVMKTLITDTKTGFRSMLIGKGNIIDLKTNIKKVVKPATIVSLSKIVPLKTVKTRYLFKAPPEMVEDDFEFVHSPILLGGEGLMGGGDVSTRIDDKIIFEPRTGLKVGTRIGVVEKTDHIFKPTTIVDSRIDVGQKQKDKTLTDTLTISRTQEIFKPATLTELRFDTALKEDTLERMETATELVTDLRTRTITFPKPVPPPTRGGWGLLPLPSIKSTSKAKTTVRKVPAFSVSAKSKGKWLKLSKNGLTKNEALRLGVQATDNTAARTFRIKQTNKQVKDTRTRPPSLFKYRQPVAGSKLKKGETWIEKTAFAIDTSGEHKGITVKGWLAARKKKQTSSKKPVKRKKGKKKTPKKRTGRIQKMLEIPALRF